MQKGINYEDLGGKEKQALKRMLDECENEVSADMGDILKEVFKEQPFSRSK